jgi:hypothetical protein
MESFNKIVFYFFRGVPTSSWSFEVFHIWLFFRKKQCRNSKNQKNTGNNQIPILRSFLGIASQLYPTYSNKIDLGGKYEQFEVLE